MNLRMWQIMLISFKSWLLSEEMSAPDMARLLDVSTVIKGPFKFYHGATTGPDDSYLRSFQIEGAMGYGSGHGQGGGFYVWTEIPNGLEYAKKHAQGRTKGAFKTSGSIIGDPMVIEIEVPELDFDKWDFDIENSSKEINENPLTSIMFRKGTIEKLKKLGKVMYSQKTLDYLMKDKSFGNFPVRGIDFSNPIEFDGGVSFELLDEKGEKTNRRSRAFRYVQGGPAEAQSFAPIYYGFQDAVPEFHKKLEAWWFSQNYGKKVFAIKYTGSSAIKPSKILVYKNGEWIDNTKPTEDSVKNYTRLGQECRGKYWGISGAGILPYCTKTKRFLPNKRSAQVMQGGTYGIFGGGIFMKDALHYGVKSHDELLKTPSAFEEHAKVELREETGYNGPINLELLYVFKDEDCKFHYHNFLGKVSEEFKPQAESDSAWEVEGTDKWVTYDELLQLNPKHFGLKALLQNAGDKLKSLAGTSQQASDAAKEKTIEPLYTNLQQ